MSDPMTPAVPDPTVEALARLRDARTAHEWPVETDDGLDYSRCTCGAKPPYSPGGSEDGFWWAQHHDEALVRAACAVTPDALRDRLQALCDAAMRNKWHLGTEAVSLTVAQVLAVVGETK